MTSSAIGITTQSRNPEIVAVPTAYRVTPTDGPTFGEVMKISAKQLLRGATAAVSVLPAGSMLAASVRPSGLREDIVSVSGALTGATPTGAGSTGAAGSTGTVVGVPDRTAEGANVGMGDSTDGQQAAEAALSRSQDMNMYMIALQERVSAQNRAFTTYSNVLKAKHDTVKNAINNIR